MRLQGKVALITGASRGVGRRLAAMLAEAGADIVLTSRTFKSSDSEIPGSLEEAAQEVRAQGAKAYPIQCDLTRPEDVERLCGTVMDQVGHLDILVHNATNSQLDQHYAPFQKLRPDLWRDCLEVALFAPIAISQRFIPEMIQRRQGAILFMSSAYGYTDHLQIGHNIAHPVARRSSFGLATFLSKETVNNNIPVFILDPGGTRSERLLWEVAHGYEFVDVGSTASDGLPKAHAPEVPALAARYLLTCDNPMFYNGKLVVARELVIEHNLIPRADWENYHLTLPSQMVGYSTR